MFQATLKGAWASSLLVQAKYDQETFELWFDFECYDSEDECHAEIIKTFEEAASIIIKEYKQNIPFFASLKKIELSLDNGNVHVKLTKKDGNIQTERIKVAYREQKILKREILS